MRFKKAALIFSLVMTPMLITSCNAFGEKGEKGEKGDPGESIKVTNVEYVGIFGDQDQYKITYSDGTTHIVNVPRSHEVKQEYTVKFVVDGAIYESQTVKEGEYLKKITPPEKPGKTFEGWYTTGGEKWVFIGFQVHSDLSLYARYIDGEGEGEYIPPVPETSEFETLTYEKTRFKIKDVFTQGEETYTTPSIGKTNILVVPVEFSDLKQNFSFKQDDLDKLDVAFNGSKPDGTTDYWESLSSFYKKTSYGALDLNCIITDPFTPSFTSKQFIKNEELSDGGGTYKLVEEAYRGVKLNGVSVNFRDSKYDADGDNKTDGVWFIYNEKDQAKGDSYWPYVYWYDTDKNLSISNYANCALSFLYEDSPEGIDTHTLIHETGHLLGLDDYYTYDTTSSGYSFRSASGQKDMMDNNIGDHCSYSKFLLGWTEPIIPKTSGKFILRPFEDTGDTIILANNFNDSAFSEYLILSYYTPTGLNERDSINKYPGRDYMYKTSGLQVYHVDSRIGLYKYNSMNGGITPHSYLDNNITSIPRFNIQNYPYIASIAHSNTRSRCMFGDNKDLLAYIPKDNKAVYNAKSDPTETSLFKTGDKFNALQYSKFLPNGMFNDGSKCNFSFEVVSMDNEGLTLQINL